MEKRTIKKTDIYALTAVLIWSTTAALVKKMLSDLPNLEILSVTSLFAFLFLLMVNFAGGRLRSLKNYSIKEYGIMSGLGFIGLFLYSALYYYGLSQLSSQEACVLNYLWPAMLLMFSCVLLKEHLTVMKIVAIVCSFAGVILLSSGTVATASGNVPLGAASCIAAAACYGLFSVLNKKAALDQNITNMVIWLTVAICAAALGCATETWVPIQGSQWLGLLWIGAGINAAAYLLWALALNGSKTTAAIANLAYLTPFLSLIVSSAVLKEKIQPHAFAALLFIVGGILAQRFYDCKRMA